MMERAGAQAVENFLTVVALATTVMLGPLPRCVGYGPAYNPPTTGGEDAARPDGALSSGVLSTGRLGVSSSDQAWTARVVQATGGPGAERRASQCGRWRPTRVRPVGTTWHPRELPVGRTGAACGRPAPHAPAAVTPRGATASHLLPCHDRLQARHGNGPDPPRRAVGRRIRRSAVRSGAARPVPGGPDTAPRSAAPDAHARRRSSSSRWGGWGQSVVCCRHFGAWTTLSVWPWTSPRHARRPRSNVARTPSPLVPPARHSELADASGSAPTRRRARVVRAGVSALRGRCRSA